MIGALRYLTVLPVSGAASPGRAAFWFPIVGAAVGWIAGQALQWMALLVPGWLGSLVVLAACTALYGGRNEMALGRRFGMWAPVVALIVRWQVISRFPAGSALWLAACFALSHASLVAMAWISRPIDSAGDDTLPAQLTTVRAVSAIIAGASLAFLPGIQGAVGLLGAAILMTHLLIRWFDAGDGGMDRDTLRASTLCVETLCLAAATWLTGHSWVQR